MNLNFNLHHRAVVAMPCHSTSQQRQLRLTSQVDQFFTRRVLLLFLCLAIAALPALAQIIWTGATSNDWATATNWDAGKVPTADDDVVIPELEKLEQAGNQPIIYSG